jgi:oxalate---CoA ligase
LLLLSHSQSSPTTPLLSIPQILIHQAEHAPDAIAILAPGRHPLTYGRLRRQISDVGKTLHTIGVSRNDRVALVLPDGPEMAVAFLAVAASATSAPLNPTYSADEFAIYLADLRAKALIRVYFDLG